MTVYKKKANLAVALRAARFETVKPLTILLPIRDPWGDRAPHRQAEVCRVRRHNGREVAGNVPGVVHGEGRVRVRLTVWADPVDRAL